MKRLLIGLGVLVVLLVLGVVWVLGSLDAIVKDQIETVGTELTGTRVGVAGVDIKLTEGVGEITGLTVANPKGYRTDYAFRMNRLRLGIDLASVGKEPLVLDELLIAAPQVNLELNEKGGSNLKELSDNVAANTAKADQQAAKAQQEAGGEPLRMQIRKLVIQDAGYAIHSPLQQLDGRSGTLPAIALSNVGGSRGSTPGEIGRLVIGKLAQSAIKEGAQAGVKSAVGEKLKDVGGDLGGALKKLVE